MLKVEKQLEIQSHTNKLPGERIGSPKAILQLANILHPDEADTILKVTQDNRRIDWELWK